jgi:hypothetical protein
VLRDGAAIVIAFDQGKAFARRFALESPADLKPLLDDLGLEVVPWRFSGRVREVIVEGVVGIDDRLSPSWVRWLTAHAIGHHVLHTGTSFYLESWQWVNRRKAERQAEEFVAGLLTPQGLSSLVGRRRLSRRCGIPETKAGPCRRAGVARLNAAVDPFRRHQNRGAPLILHHAVELVPVVVVAARGHEDRS